MLATLLEKRLKRLKADKIIVVMDGGKAFLGVLKDFDEGTIILTDVCEGPSSEIKWETLGEEEREKASEESFEEAYGFVDWVCVNLAEVYLRVDHISRIWPWEHIGKEGAEKKKAGRHPTYSRTPAADLLREEG
ncbi:MAG: hypothetical protein ACOC55_04475 [Candidatus Natronoplasma sp.]